MLHKNSTELIAKLLSEKSITEDQTPIGWIQGSGWENNFPDSVYLAYHYEDKKIEFIIKDGIERSIYFTTIYKNIFDSLTYRLQDLGFKVVQKEVSSEKGYEFDIDHPEPEHIIQFIAEIEKIYPLSASIKKVIFDYTDALKNATPHDAFNLLTNEFEKIQNELLSLQHKMWEFEIKLNEYVEKREDTLESNSSSKYSHS